MIVIVNYVVGNLLSVNNMTRKTGAEVKIPRDPDEIADAEKLLLHGIGHFDHDMNMLKSSYLHQVMENVLGCDRHLMENRLREHQQGTADYSSTTWKGGSAAQMREIEYGVKESHDLKN